MILYFPPFLKRAFFVILFLFALLGATALVVPWVVDGAHKQAEIVGYLKTHYQLSLEVGGETDVSAFPSPMLQLRRVSLHKDGEKEAALLQAEEVNIHIGWIGLLQGHIDSASMVRPTITLQQQEFSDLIAYLLSREPVSTPPPPISKIELVDGSLNVKSSGKKKARLFSNLSATISLPDAHNSLRIDASATSNNTPFDVALSVDTSQERKVQAEFALRQQSRMTLSGVMKPKADSAWQASVEANIADLGDLVAFATDTPYTPKGHPQSFNFKGNAHFQDHRLMINRTNASFNGKEGRFAAYIGWKRDPVFAFELGAETLDAQSLVQSLEPSIFPPIPENASAVIVKELAPVRQSISVLLSADHMTYGQREYGNPNLFAEMDDSNLILHSATLAMPGGTNLDIQGVVTQQLEGRRFNGKAHVYGKHLNEWLGEFEPYTKNLPAEDFSDFSLEGNLFISAEQLRLSEAKLRVNAFELVGGFATYFEKMPRVEAEVKLANANLDYFRDVWRAENAIKPEDAYQLLANNKKHFDWLKRLPAILDLNIAIEGFRFLDAEGQTATMRLYISPGAISLHGLDVRFPMNTLSGNIKFNVLSDRPQLDTVLNINQFNTDYFSGDSSQSSKPWFDLMSEEQRFSQELFDVRWMNMFDGSIDISTNTLTHRGKEYAGFKWRAELKNAVMSIQKLSFKYLDGDFDINGTLMGGKVPGLSASFALYNSDLKALLKEYFNIESIDGRVSLTGLVSTSGIHMKSWVEQGDMKLTAVARGVRVQHLNLQSSVDTTAAARSTQDVAEGVKNMVFDGTTELTVDGNINFQQGIVKTPGIRLTSNRITGLLKGEMQLLPWALSLTTQWQFPELSSTTIPTMTMTQQGTINDYTTRIDTSSLEAFVAKRIISQ